MFTISIKYKGIIIVSWLDYNSLLSLSSPSKVFRLTYMYICILFGVNSVIKNGSAFSEDNFVKFVL